MSDAELAYELKGFFIDRLGTDLVALKKKDSAPCKENIIVWVLGRGIVFYFTWKNDVLTEVPKTSFDRNAESTHYWLELMDE